MKAMILAAGQGTRLRPLTDHCPKAMLPVAGRPVIEWILRWLRRHWIREVVISLYHCPDVLTDYVGDGSRWGLAVDYLRETELLETGDAVQAVGPRLGDEFVVVYSDILTNLDLTEMLRWHAGRCDEPHATLWLVQSEHPWSSGQVATGAGGRVTRFAEKAGRDDVFTDWVSAGVMVLPQAALAGPAPGDLGGGLLPRLVEGGLPCYGWRAPAGTTRHHFGSPESYARVQAELAWDGG